MCTIYKKKSSYLHSTGFLEATRRIEVEPRSPGVGADRSPGVGAGDILPLPPGTEASTRDDKSPRDTDQENGQSADSKAGEPQEAVGA